MCVVIVYKYDKLARFRLLQRCSSCLPSTGRHVAPRPVTNLKRWTPITQ